LLVGASAAPGQGTPPPCPAGVVAHAVVGAADWLTDESGGRLYATHPITFGIGFPDDGPGIEPGSEVFTPPAGAVRASDDLGANGAIPDQGIGESASVVDVLAQPGPVPVSVSWVQSDGSQQGECSAATSATFALLGAVPARLTRPKSTPGLPDESRVRVKLPRSGPDLGALEVRYRAVKAERFPGPGVRARTVTIPLVRASTHNPQRAVTFRTGGLKLLVEPQSDDLRTPVLFTFHAKANPGRGTRYGYDLALLQGGTRVGRLRVAGQCHRVSGFVLCSRKRVSLR
jgi:hypothetical protein